MNELRKQKLCPQVKGTISAFYRHRLKTFFHFSTSSRIFLIVPEKFPHLAILVTKNGTDFISHISQNTIEHIHLIDHMNLCNLSLQHSLLFFLAATLVGRVRASCECTKINNWDDLRNYVLALNKVSEERQLKLLLCPFEITKHQNEDTNHWMEFIPINNPIHIQCQKLKPDDKCTIEIDGPRCGTNANCGRKLFRIKSGV